MICELDENAGRIYQREILLWSEALSNPGGPEQHPILLPEQNVYISWGQSDLDFLCDEDKCILLFPEMWLQRYISKILFFSF